MGLAHSSQRKSRKRREKKITELSSTFEWEISANIGRESKKRTTMEDSIEIRKIWINEFTELQRRHRYTLTTREREKKNMKENCARIIAIVDVKHERREKTNPYEPNTTFSLLFILIVFYSFFFLFSFETERARSTQSRWTATHSYSYISAGRAVKKSVCNCNLFNFLITSPPLLFRRMLSRESRMNEQICYIAKFKPETEAAARRKKQLHSRIYTCCAWTWATTLIYTTKWHTHRNKHELPFSRSRSFLFLLSIHKLYYLVEIRLIHAILSIYDPYNFWWLLLLLHFAIPIIFRGSNSQAFFLTVGPPPAVSFLSLAPTLWAFFIKWGIKYLSSKR